MALYPYYNNSMMQTNQMQQQQYNVLPQQQILRANGKASIDAIRMAPNSSALIMDTTAPIVWECTSDSLGTVTKEPWDVKRHVEEPTVDINTFEHRLSEVEKSIFAIMEALKDDKKSYDASTEPTKHTNKR